MEVEGELEVAKGVDPIASSRSHAVQRVRIYIWHYKDATERRNNKDKIKYKVYDSRPFELRSEGLISQGPHKRIIYCRRYRWPHDGGDSFPSMNSAMLGNARDRSFIGRGSSAKYFRNM